MKFNWAYYGKICKNNKCSKPPTRYVLSVSMKFLDSFPTSGNKKKTSSSKPQKTTLLIAVAAKSVFLLQILFQATNPCSIGYLCLMFYLMGNSISSNLFPILHREYVLGIFVISNIKAINKYSQTYNFLYCLFKNNKIVCYLYYPKPSLFRSLHHWIAVFQLHPPLLQIFERSREAVQGPLQGGPEGLRAQGLPVLLEEATKKP